MYIMYFYRLWLSHSLVDLKRKVLLHVNVVMMKNVCFSVIIIGAAAWKTLVTIAHHLETLFLIIISTNTIHLMNNLDQVVLHYVQILQVDKRPRKVAKRLRNKNTDIFQKCRIKSTSKLICVYQLLKLKRKVKEKWFSTGNACHLCIKHQVRLEKSLYISVIFTQWKWPCWLEEKISFILWNRFDIPHLGHVNTNLLSGKKSMQIQFFCTSLCMEGKK